MLAARRTVARSKQALLLVLVVFDLAFLLHSVFQACGIHLEDLAALAFEHRIAGYLLALLILGSRRLLLLEDLEHHPIAPGIDRSADLSLVEIKSSSSL